MASINLGRVGFVLRGNYAATEEYNPLDVVYYPTTGMCYAAKDNISNIPPTVDTSWQCLVEINQVIDTSTMALINASAVRFDAAQNLTDAQKLQARQNIGSVEIYSTDADSSGSGMMIVY